MCSESSAVESLKIFYELTGVIHHLQDTKMSFTMGFMSTCFLNSKRAIFHA